MDRRSPVGDHFKLLGVLFDAKLEMFAAACAIASQAGTHLRTLLRGSRFFGIEELVRLYKANVLSYIETWTPALYHAAPLTLSCIDALQDTFLCHVDISPSTALDRFGLVPLKTRRDIAMLGLLHRVRLRIAPTCLMQLFPFERRPIYSYGVPLGKPRHVYQLADPVSRQSPMFFRRSIFGLIHVYNDLDPVIVEADNVKSFQHKLQALVKDAVHSSSAECWQSILSPC